MLRWENQKHKSEDRLPLTGVDVFQYPVFAKAMAGKGAVAQSVEQRTENPCVGGSIPPHTTTKRKNPLPERVFSYSAGNSVQKYLFLRN